jgi:hypothetical protein
LPPEDNPIKSPVLTSPSLDDLNSKVEDSWSKSRPTSPSSSTSSTSTIKPIELQDISTHINLDNISSSSNSVLYKVTEISDPALYPNKPGLRPFVEISKMKNSVTLNEDTWKDFINKGVLNRIQFIEDTFADENELTKEAALKMSDYLVDLCDSYDAFTKLYTLNVHKLKPEQISKLKELTFHMRSWLSDFHSKIVVHDQTNITKGDITDSPRTTTKEMLEIFEE